MVLLPSIHSLCAPKGIIITSGPILGYTKILKIRYYFRHETQSKHCEIHVFKFRIKQNYSTMVLIPYIHSLCPPKGIIIKSGPNLGYVKIRKRQIIFDTKLNQNNMNYMFLNFESNNFLHHGFTTFDTLPMCPQRHHYQF